MILEGFEIENWSCIKKLAVSNLPATGVIVLHGPNRTGKSSIVQALRACLVDYPSKTAALKSFYPRGTGETPTVTVTFRARGTTYRIRKQFGSTRSELASKTSTGNWKVETTTAAEAHERTCGYAGGSDSTKGLHQLLWLTQAEFRLPDARRLDPTVQAQLRGVLGVLQTPLDDRFIERVKRHWNVWFSGQRKVGKAHEIKDACKLAESLDRLEICNNELKESESQFNEVERLLRQAADLELLKLELDRQRADCDEELRQRRDEQRQCQTRVVARRQAEKDFAAAEKETTEALAEQSQRLAAANRLLDDEKNIEPAQGKVDTKGQQVKLLEERQAQQRNDLGVQRESRRKLQVRANRVAAKQRNLDDADKLDAALEDLRRAQTIVDAIASIETFLAENAAPDTAGLEKLKENRQQVARLQAERDAASMNLTLTPDKNAAAAQLALDGGAPRELKISAPATHSVRRRAELLISGWGRIELSRPSGSGDLDQIEEALQSHQEGFSNAVATYGIAGSDPNALDQLIQRAAEHRLKSPELDKQKKDLKKLAPKGIEPLQARVIEFQTKLKEKPENDSADAESLPTERNELSSLATKLRQEISSADKEIERLEKDAEAAQAEMNRARSAETTAKEELAACKAKAGSTREELQRLRTDDQIAQRVDNAKRSLETSRAQLEQTELTSQERTIAERLEAAETAVRAIETQIADNANKYHEIKGRLMAAEGLHARRSSLAARVDELTRLTEQESLEKDAVDRLYALFEECRDKQLDTLMGPIHDRVLGWMRALDIGDYKEMKFTDAFLPDKLLSRDGTSEFTLDEESTGAQEQIAMFVRLALGSALASADEPAIAMLDDPLTHCDHGRLNKMRVVLRRAAEGDPMLNPPAGPLQIMIFTCHSEWFRDERAIAKVIDLEDPQVMTRFAV